MGEEEQNPTWARSETRKEGGGQDGGEQDKSPDVSFSDAPRTINAYLDQFGVTQAVELEGISEESTPASEILSVEGGEKYNLGSLISKGGMGTVHQARDVNCRRQVAMKRLGASQQRSSEDLLRFIEEAQITSQLEHPNIVPVHELGIDADGSVFYTMKYVKGVTLTEIIMKIRKGDAETLEEYPLPRLLTIFQKACDAVAFAHSKGVVHRDLKPDNIMLGDYGEVLVVDWGLAKVLNRPDRADREGPSGSFRKFEAPQDDTTLPPTTIFKVSPKKPPTRAKSVDPDDQDTIDSIRMDDLATDFRTIHGRVMGTPGFMAPEQAMNQEIDHRSDIYALGAILYSILTLHPPISGKVPEVLRKIARGQIVPPTAYCRIEDMKREHAAFADELPPKSKHALLHCPDGLIPAALSDITMQALATNPDERFASVQELQKEIESYQNGITWNLVIEETFETDDIEQRWEITNGQYEIVDGELRLHGGEPQFMLLKNDVSGDVRIEFECRQESPYLSTIGCFMGGLWLDRRIDIPATGYELKFGGYDNSRNILARSDKILWSEKASPLERNMIYHVRAERVGSQLKLTVNDEEIYCVTDGDPLSGKDRTAVGILGWMAETRYSHIRVYTRSTPWIADVIEIADRHLHKGHYTTAMDLYEEVISSSPDVKRLQRARRGHRNARMQKSLVDNMPKWQDKLSEVWPDTDFSIRLDNLGLTVDLTAAGVKDLSPLKGMPVTTLYCSANRVESLEPLRGMPLTVLNCSANPISNLEPLRGMQLVTLICESCPITSLEPVEAMPLTMLNCGGTKCSSLEPLRGMGLQWLSFWGCGVRHIDALTGMPLTSLFCDANDIEDLTPLKGMPLNSLHCSGNRIHSLEPLREAPLTILHAGSNQIKSLEPLRRMSLNMLSCHGNLITDLSPLQGMPLGAVVCGDNRFTDLGPLKDHPPPKLLFDSDSLSDEAIDACLTAWEKREGLDSIVRDTQTLLAARARDIDGLKKLATTFDGHRYLFIPRFMMWHDARDFCKELGGHLVTIADKVENDFIESMVPGGSWFWIGLETDQHGHAWVTGEPCNYTTFVDVVRAKQHGPKVYFSGTWSADLSPTAQNPFMIEWDK